ncbi:MAG: biotin/lipoyl-binding protein [Gammaproteobacteria bacterium]|nr:biotin/lipoyl-binding protein [Gammaproteobacteria bacterium]
MKHRILFAVAFLGIIVGLASAYLYQQKLPVHAPLAPSRDPYTDGIYAEGIIQSPQESGENINIYPDVAGTVTHIFVQEGQTVDRGAPLLAIDDSVQKEIVAEDRAKIGAAQAALVYQRDQLAILEKEIAIDPRAVSRMTLVTAQDNVLVARQNLKVAVSTHAADQALLDKYLVHALVPGTVLRVWAGVGSYVSAQGVYGTYSQGMDPVITMGRESSYLQVQCYLDEILVPRLPPARDIAAKMFVRGANNVSIPLQFVRIQPYVTPKIELSDQRTEKVDVRVLPVIFQFQVTKGINLYPGELVDVYIGKKS